MLKKTINHLLDFVWPQFCLGCQREGSLCCGYCLNDILLEDYSQVDWPGQNKIYFSSCHICCDYHHPLIQKLVKSYKYKYIEKISDLLINILEKQSRRLDLRQNTIITNVPLHKSKLKKRGFDQTEILAKGLSKQLDLKYTPLLKRIKKTKTQAQLSKSERQKNVQGVFEYQSPASRWASRGASVLLIDDIATTGSTLNQAAKTLFQAGYKNIICLVLAKN